MKKVLLVGPGKFAVKHIKCIRNIEGVEITGICGTTIEKAKDFADKWQPQAGVFDDIKKALASDDYHYCIICTPRTVRIKQIEACIKKNVPMLIEKPPCSTIMEGKKIQRIIKESNIIHTVGFMHRWNESLNYCLDKMSGERIMLINVRFYNTFYHQLDRITPKTFTPFSVSKSGGMIGDQCIHYFDLVRYITKSEAKEIRGIYKTNQGIPVLDEDTTVDTLVLTLEMKNKSILNHMHTWCAPYPGLYVDIMSDKSLVSIDIFSNKAGGEIGGEKFNFVGTLDEYENEHRGLLKAIEENNPNIIRSPYSDALKTFELTEKILSF